MCIEVDLIIKYTTNLILLIDMEFISHLTYDSGKEVVVNIDPFVMHSEVDLISWEEEERLSSPPPPC
jgi:hypothetical protein